MKEHLISMLAGFVVAVLILSIVFVVAFVAVRAKFNPSSEMIWVLIGAFLGLAVIIPIVESIVKDKL